VSQAESALKQQSEHMEAAAQLTQREAEVSAAGSRDSTAASNTQHTQQQPCMHAGAVHNRLDRLCHFRMAASCRAGVVLNLLLTFVCGPCGATGAVQ
jgi:hypothetical protein